MGKIYFLKGLPGSGKSTKSREIMAEDPRAARVNKDDLRKMLRMHEKNDSFLGKSWESAVVAIERVVSKELLEAGYNLIVDNTHFGNKHFLFYKELSRQGKHELEIVDLTNVPIEVCVERDKKRTDAVGRNVIYGMAIRAGLIDSGSTKNKKVELDSKYIIVDLDGTLANCDHRLHYVRNDNNTKDWNKFFDLMEEDTINEHVLSLMRDTYKDYKVVIVTGRPESHRVPTESWLDSYEIEREAVLMRGYGDFKSDVIVKEEILLNFLDKDKIVIVIDDRPKVIDMWRRNNLQVIDVGDGIYF